ncbi:hypothetical protein KY49_731 [Burkholderia sp. MSHR3999]|uniref:hypothetical protein n=1 Tax=Burkholderia sp. MSHR3999 TaxID=1542965 RepID=UPI0005B6ABC3|nr:hypothetical protein [Burkholderia sp. MSHR3999]KIP14667.1 hypothetical protein KY49_731 [Burkholderia sp. MSHR3999]
MQGFNIGAVQAPADTVAGQAVPPTGGGGWAANCQPGLDGTTPDADFFNDLLGNVLRVLQAAGVAPTPNRFDDLVNAINALINTALNGPQAAIANLETDVNGQAASIQNLGTAVNGQNSAIQNLNNAVNGQNAAIQYLNETFNTENANFQSQLNGKQPAGNYLTTNIGYANVGSISICSNPSWTGLGQQVAGCTVNGAGAAAGTWISIGLVSSGATPLYLAQRIA